MLKDKTPSRQEKNILTPDIKAYINSSVLCWLATASSDNVPNVSPKEAFTWYGVQYLIIANIASPQTIKNIKQNNTVCVSFIDVFLQKGYQIKGSAGIIKKPDPEFSKMETSLLKITGGKFPFSTITAICIETVKPIVAPRYILYPETTEEEQIESALHTYKVHRYI